VKKFIYTILLSVIFIDYGNGASLIEVYEEALVNDPFLKEALANKEAVIEVKPQARSFILPQLTSSASFSDNDSDGSSTFQQKIINPISGDAVVITNNTQFLQYYSPLFSLIMGMEPLLLKSMKKP